mgnify:CR=1 FL=1
MNFLYMSFSAGCIVLFTVLLRTLFKKKLPIELFCGLWWLAMLRALVPFSIPSVYSVYNAKIGIEGWFEKSLDFTLSERIFAERAEAVVSVICMILIFSVAVFSARYFIRVHRCCSNIAENAALGFCGQPCILWIFSAGYYSAEKFSDGGQGSAAVYSAA